MKVTSIETKNDKNGNPMKITQFENGAKVFVNSKYDSTIYEQVVVGADFELTKDGNFDKIKYDKPAPKPAGNFTKTAIMDKAMDRKEQTIKTFQANKEDSIKMAGAIRDAVLITTAIMRHRPLTASEIESTITEWQAKIYNLHDQPFLSAPLPKVIEEASIEYPTELGPNDINF